MKKRMVLVSTLLLTSISYTLLSMVPQVLPKETAEKSDNKKDVAKDGSEVQAKAVRPKGWRPDTPEGKETAAQKRAQELSAGGGRKNIASLCKELGPIIMAARSQAAEEKAAKEGNLHRPPPPPPPFPGSDAPASSSAASNPRMVDGAAAINSLKSELRSAFQKLDDLKKLDEVKAQIGELSDSLKRVSTHLENETQKLQSTPTKSRSQDAFPQINKAILTKGGLITGGTALACLGLYKYCIPFHDVCMKLGKKIKSSCQKTLSYCGEYPLLSFMAGIVTGSAMVGGLWYTGKLSTS